MSARVSVVAALLLAAGAAAAQPAAYRVETLAEGLEHPWSVAFLPGGRLLVTERPGRLRVIRDGRLLEQAVQGVPTVHTGGQAGLFDAIPAPDFADSGTLYLSHACGDHRENNTCLTRARLDGDRLVDVHTVFTAQPVKRGDAHYGGRIVFLPDGTLALSLGDGFDYREQAQDPSNHIGTIVRLTPEGTAAGDNPFIGRDAHAPEVLSYGHRNVQGLMFDAERGMLIAHEHGPQGGDELNVIEPGANYGWPLVTFGIDYTGALITPFQTRDGIAMPAHHWVPSIAPSGLAVYRGELFPEWDGDLLVGALARDRGVHRLRLEGGVAEPQEVLLAELGARIRDVRVGPDGAIYVVTDDPANGRVLRLVPAD